MRKIWRLTAVKEAVMNWDRSEWFTSYELLDMVREYIPQKGMGMNSLGVAKMLMRLEKEGSVESERTCGAKRYRRAENVAKEGGV